MKNYYDLLEVSHLASQEVIEKAYKTLVKKYHPDLQNDDIHKQEAEQKMKEINEAYDIISNPEKRSSYDQELKNLELEQQKLHEKEIQQQSQNIYYENENLYSEDSNKNNYKKTNEHFYKNVRENKKANANYNDKPIDKILQNQQIQFEIEKQKAIEQAYYDAYIQDLKNRGYKIKYKKTFKEHVKNIFIILILILILFLVFQIPFVKNYFTTIYSENELIKWIVDFFADVFK